MRKKTVEENSIAAFSKCSSAHFKACSKGKHNGKTQKVKDNDGRLADSRRWKGKKITGEDGPWPPVQVKMVGKEKANREIAN